MAVRRLSSPDCIACSAIADFIKEVSQDGGQVIGEGWTPRNLQTVSFKPGRNAVVDVTTSVAEQRVRASAGGKVESFRGGTRVKTFWLVSEGTTWTVTRLDQPK